MAVILKAHSGPQSTAFLSIASEILYGGAAGGGKSHLLRLIAIALAIAVPGIQIYLFRRISLDLIANHIDGASGFPVMLAEWVDSGFAKINETTGKIKFSTGSTIHLCHCHHEKDKYKYQGAEINVLLIDELTHFTATIYRYLRGRVRLGGLQIPPGLHWNLPMIICGSNPGNVGHTWVKQMFITGRRPFEIKKTPVTDGGMDRQFIPAKLTDNPTLLENDPLYADRLKGLGSDMLVRAMLDGDWDIVAGGMFDDVWRSGFNIIPAPFKPPPGFTITRAFDWGSSKPFSVGWWAEADGSTPIALRGNSEVVLPKGSKIRFSEWYGWNGNPNEGSKMLSKDIARGILEREAAMQILGRVRPGIADSSIYDHHDGKSIASEMATVGVKFSKAMKGPGTRIRGWQVVREMMKAAHQWPIEEPCLLVTENCTDGFIRTVPILPRDERQTEDVDTDAEDHTGDETRYELFSRRGKTTRVALKGT